MTIEDLLGHLNYHAKLTELKFKVDGTFVEFEGGFFSDKISGNGNEKKREQSFTIELKLPTGKSIQSLDEYGR